MILEANLRSRNFLVLSLPLYYFVFVSNCSNIKPRGLFHENEFFSGDQLCVIHWLYF